MSEQILDGCAPEPLMGYLKALGVLRLVCEQADPDAGGCWRDNVFVLETKFDRDGLVKFFRDEYKPTPLLAPWNGGSGFYIKLDLDRFLKKKGEEADFKSRDVVEAIDAIESSDVERLAKCRAQIKETKRALCLLGHRVDFAQTMMESLQEWPHAKTKNAQKKVKAEATKLLNSMLLFQSEGRIFSIGKAEKDAFISDLRGKVLTDDGLLWLDAALAMRTGQVKNRVEAPTLGSGGNIGNSDFSARFAQMLPKVVALRTGDPIPDGSAALLHAALFGTPAPGLPRISVDQFDPGKAGGANGTQGMEAGPTLNPWDYLLMMEGALVLAGNTSRRLGAGRSEASFPFVVDSSPAGHGSVGDDNTRGEAWLPLWSSPAPFGEVKFMLGEGRAEVGGRRASSGLTFAQAVAGLGVDRGIRSFVRYEFQERLGQSYIATPVGRFDVPQAPLNGIELVRSLNDWLSSYRIACRTKKDGAKAEPPPRFPSSFRRIQSVIFDYCRYGGADRLILILAALGRAERELAVGDMKPEKRRTSRPLGGLASAWLTMANDQSAEFHLARGLASLNQGAKGTRAIRSYLEPVEWDKKYRRWTWGERGGHVVWGSGNVIRSLGAILIRRLMEAEKNGEAVLPLDSPFPIPLVDIAAFLNGDIDDAKFEDLLWGLSLVDCGSAREVSKSGTDAELPRAYALMKLTLLPGRLDRTGSPNGDSVLRVSRPPPGDALSGVAVKTEPAIPAKLRAGDIQGACEVAVRRLHAWGFTPLCELLANGARREIDWAGGGIPPERLLAALLFPIPEKAVNVLAELVLRVPSAKTLM